jgi:hypothetical protein
MPHIIGSEASRRGGDVLNTYDSQIGQVDNRGYATTLSENNEWVGTVKRQQIYTPYDQYLGRVKAIGSAYGAGINDAQRAGAALVLLVLSRRS